MNGISRRLAAVLLAALALVVAGCGSSSDKEQTAATATAAATVTETPTATPTATATQEADSGDGESAAKKKQDEAAAKAGGAKDCDAVGKLDAKPKHALPSDVPLVADAKVYESQGPFGKTTRFFASTDGDAGELPTVRDAAAKALTDAGYKLLDTDQEEGTEAEAHLSGAHTVDLQVIVLCSGKLRVRYTVS